MPNASKYTFVDEDNSQTVEEAVLGITGLSGITTRGPINDPTILITSERQIRRLYGSGQPGSTPGQETFIQHCINILRKGGQVRVNRIVHFTDVTDPATVTATKVADLTLSNGADPAVGLFKLSALYPGANYASMRAVVSNASNGVATSFDLTLYIIGDETYSTENFKNLSFNPADPNAFNAAFDTINQASDLVRAIEMPSVPVTAGNNRPVNGTFAFTGGSDGGTVLPADYIGAEVAKTGFYAFNKVSDLSQVAVPTIYNTDVLNGGAIYADGRKDLMFFAHLNPLPDFNDIAAQRDLVTSATEYTAFFSGGTVKKDDALRTVEISEISDVVAIANKVDTEFGPWYSLAGTNRGVVKDALGVVENFGSPGDYNALNFLANRQINMMVNKNGKTYLSGNFTGQTSDSKKSYLNIVRLLIYLKKSLGPTLEKYLEEPMDIPTFIKLANEVEPFLQSIKDLRGLYDFDWDGDQNVGNILNVRINNLEDIDAGKYKVKLRLEPINSIGEIEVGISIEKTGTISMEILSDTTNP